MLQALPAWSLPLITKYPTVMFSTGPMFVTLQVQAPPSAACVAAGMGTDGGQEHCLLQQHWGAWLCCACHEAAARDILCAELSCLRCARSQ